LVEHLQMEPNHVKTKGAIWQILALESCTNFFSNVAQWNMLWKTNLVHNYAQQQLLLFLLTLTFFDLAASATSTTIGPSGRIMT